MTGKRRAATVSNASRVAHEQPAPDVKTRSPKKSMSTNALRCFGKEYGNKIVKCLRIAWYGEYHLSLFPQFLVRSRYLRSLQRETFGQSSEPAPPSQRPHNTLSVKRGAFIFLGNRDNSVQNAIFSKVSQPPDRLRFGRSMLYGRR